MVLSLSPRRLSPGYVLLQVDDLDEAVEIAKEWPILEIRGVSIEVRPVAELCGR